MLFITGSLSSDWENFKRDFDKQYASPEEETEREQIFLENVDRIKEYERTHPDATFTMEINHLTDQHISVSNYSLKTVLKKTINYLLGISHWFKIIFEYPFGSH